MLTINTFQTQEDLLRTEQLVNRINKEINNGRTMTQELDKNAFLKLLITQLAHQDPTQPMEDKEFIAQMAQFSSLEQINNMSANIEKVAGLIIRNNALSLLGKVVELFDGNEMITGKVEKVSGGDSQQVFVGGRYYDYQAVESIIAE
jgi:flagellar basal-body rod modification protein FlgD